MRDKRVLKKRPKIDKKRKNVLTKLERKKIIQVKRAESNLDFVDELVAMGEKKLIYLQATDDDWST